MGEKLIEEQIARYHRDGFVYRRARTPDRSRGLKKARRLMTA